MYVGGTLISSVEFHGNMSLVIFMSKCPLACRYCHNVELLEDDTQKTFEDTISRLREIQFKTNFSNIKFFTTDDSIQKQASVQIMTLHKSKGDEFDYVFIPELTQDNLCFDVAKYKLKENSKFIQKIKKQPKTDLELKMEIIEENFRLIYVGITRAKKKLLLSTASNYKFFNKVQPKRASEIFEGLEYAKN